ncbi:MAG: YicC/YloC family endoribonuclease, partial [bacterium]
MTGFGRGESKYNGTAISVEIRSLNHRFLDIELRLPKNLSSHERDIKGLVSAHLSRGKVNLTVVMKGEPARTSGLVIDKELASTYVSLLNDLKRELNIADSIKLEQLLNFPDIITVDTANCLDEKLWESVQQTIEAALSDLKVMRQKEGQQLENDLASRIITIDQRIVWIEEQSKKKSKEEFARLKNKVHELVNSEFADDGRLEMEVALLADKVDVTEECIRFKSHNKLFLELLKNGKSEGRKLNFLVQEMHREANTIGAKAN